MTPETASIRQAIDSISHLEAFEESLRRRTEGITWMVWGLVFAGLTLSFYIGDLTRDAATADEPRPWSLLFPWFPWMLAGGVITAALWKSAALQTPTLHRPLWATLGGLLAVGAATVLVFIASWALPAGMQSAVTPLTLFGLAGLAVVATPLLRLSVAGRRVAIAATLVQVVCGIAIGLGGGSPNATGYTLTAVLVAATWIGAGLWETTQG